MNNACVNNKFKNIICNNKEKKSKYKNSKIYF